MSSDLHVAVKSRDKGLQGTLETLSLIDMFPFMTTYVTRGGSIQRFVLSSECSFKTGFVVQCVHDWTYYGHSI